MKEKRNRKSKKTNQMKEIWRRFRKSKTAMLGLCLLIFVLCIAIFADVITPYENAISQSANRLDGPSAAHIFGTDELGRDLFARIVHGSRYSLLIGVSTSVLALVIGAVIGELLHIEDGVTRAGDWLQKKFGKMGPLTDGFVSGSLVFAVGAMAVMGSLDSGLKNDHGILLAKSVIDFAGSVAFASSMGIGIVFSGLSVLAVEGVMTLLASLLTGVLTDAVITEISVTGSLMIIGISLNVLGVTKLRIMNMTPALLLPVLLCKFM